MNIRFTSSLTPEDESRIAPVLIRAFAGILDLLPIAYAIRIDTSGADVFHHTGGASANEWQPEPIVSRMSLIQSKGGRSGDCSGSYQLLLPSFMVEASLKTLTVGAVSAVFSILLVGATPAQAETINFLNVGNASTVTVGGTGMSAKTVQAGELNWNWITPSGGNGQSFYTYCMDVLNYLTDPQTVNVLSTESVPDTSAVADRGAKAAWLFNQYSSGIRSESNEAVADKKAAALQVAIWEVLYDATPNLASGVFQGLNDFGAGVFTQARSYLSALFQGQTIGSSSFNSALYFTSTATWLDSVGRNGVQGQDQITQVPEPGTLLLMGLGGVALFRNRRRQARS